MAQQKMRFATDQRGFTIVYDDFLESDKLDLKEKMVFIILKKYADNKTHTAFPSMETISKNAGMSRRTVIRVLSSLEQKGILKKEARYNEKGDYTSNLYTLFDYASMWNNGTDSTKEQSDLDIARSIAEEYGYTLIKADKEKGLESEPTKAQIQAPNIHNTYNKTNNSENDNQSQERYTMDEIKTLYDYETLKHNRPYDTGLDAAMSVLYDALNTTKSTIKVNGDERPTMAVIGKLMKLNCMDIEYVLDKYGSLTGEIKSHKAYLRTMLYNAKEQADLEVANRVNHDMNN